MRLMKLLADAEAGDECVVNIEQNGHQATVAINVLEVHPYTTMLDIRQSGLSPHWVQPPNMQVRMYHDANMAEVLGYQGQKRFEGRYQYPNPTMRLPDEKTQLNRFLADWLGHCLQFGQVNAPFTYMSDGV